MKKLFKIKAFLLITVATHAGQSHDSHFEAAVTNIAMLRQRSDPLGRRAYTKFVLDQQDKSHTTKQLLHDLHLTDSEGHRTEIGNKAYHSFDLKNRVTAVPPQHIKKHSSHAACFPFFRCL